ncbi:protein suppressor 2 of zeste [Halyomorpha halys]|uniref:protein suppressor 2 of zeste n=1 Tax=Halyomorpha halys TaxID=286706 RepID=UPI0006D4E645|nr:formin-J-like [Halyomorpha halys]
MTRPRKPLVREVNPHLICVLCSGYFIEATTIVECLHSFCRSCLLKYLENNKFCPICDVQLHKNNPMLSVRCDPILQQLVYKLVPGLYAKEMARRRKYYSELGGPSSDSENVEFPIADTYFSPSDSISLSLEFVSYGPKEEGCCNENDHENNGDKQAVHHRRYLQCPAAVTMSHLKKFLRMKYNLGHDYNVEILYSGEVLNDEFSLMDVAYTFSWNKASPMRFQFRMYQKPIPPPIEKIVEKEESAVEIPEPIEESVDEPMDDNVEEVADDSIDGIGDEQNDDQEETDLQQEKVKQDEEEEDDEEDIALNKRLEDAVEEETIEEIEEEESPPELSPPREPIVSKEPERPNGLKRPPVLENHLLKEPEPKKAKRSPSPKVEPLRFKHDDKRFLEDMIEEDTDEDRLHISPSEEEKSPIPVLEPVPVEKTRSEERRRERKKSKKGKHHHHHRHHDRKRCDSPPAATIVHSPENDIMKLKVKLTAIKNCNNMVKGYSVVEGGIDDKKEPKENGHSTKMERHLEKQEKVKIQKEEEAPKKPEVASYNNNNNNNNNNNHNNNNTNNNGTNNTEFSRRLEINKEKLLQMRNIRKSVPKQNGTLKVEPLKMPPSSITVSKITAAEKRQMEQQKLLMNRNNSNGLDPKRPSLEIMLVNAPRKTEVPEVKPEVKKVIRPTPPSIPLSRLPKGVLPKSSPPPLRAVKPAHEEALDLSGKSSRKSPEVFPEPPTLKIPMLGKPPMVGYGSARPCKPNQSVRQIPNPSALLYRQHCLNGRALPPPVVPLSSLRQMESMTKKIEKVAAGLSVKAAASYAAK